jgi:hypothetical protein
MAPPLEGGLGSRYTYRLRFFSTLPDTFANSARVQLGVVPRDAIVADKCDVFVGMLCPSVRPWIVVMQRLQREHEHAAHALHARILTCACMRHRWPSCAWPWWCIWRFIILSRLSRMSLVIISAVPSSLLCQCCLSAYLPGRLPALDAGHSTPSL